VQPVAVAAADLDRDGDVDLVCADRQANRVFTFRQLAPGTFETAPWLVLGTDATTAGASALACADWNLDGAVDIACTAESAGRIAVFLHGGGAFPPVPDRVLGTSATTALARGLVSSHCNGDGLLDLACVSGSGNTVAVFLATAPGTWPAAPSLVLTGAPVQDPTTLAAADLNGDGWPELVVASRATNQLAVFAQTGNGVFPFPPAAFGGPGLTDAAAQVLLADVDRDGDPDVASVQPSLANVALFFNSH
jgi:hypothetical protein